MADTDLEDNAGPRERQRRETRTSILQAALELFAERGFEGASIRDIAARPGVIHGLIKYHFNNKDELWKAAVDFLFERAHLEMQPPPGFDQLDLTEQAKVSLRQYVHYCARRPEHARIMVQESIRDSDRLRWAVERHVSPVHKSIRRIGEKRVEKGVYPNIPQHAIMYIIAGAAQFPFMLSAEARIAEGVDFSDIVEIDAYADALIAFLFDNRVN